MDQSFVNKLVEGSSRSRSLWIKTGPLAEKDNRSFIGIKWDRVYPSTEVTTHDQIFNIVKRFINNTLILNQNDIGFHSITDNLIDGHQFILYDSNNYVRLILTRIVNGKIVYDGPKHPTITLGY